MLSYIKETWVSSTPKQAILLIFEWSCNGEAVMGTKERVLWRDKIMYAAITSKVAGCYNGAKGAEQQSWQQREP